MIFVTSTEKCPHLPFSYGFLSGKIDISTYCYEKTESCLGEDWNSKTVPDKCDTQSTGQVKRNPRCANTPDKKINVSKRRMVHANEHETNGVFVCCV